MLPLALTSLLIALTASCIVVRELEVETTDAGISSPPIIESAEAPFEFPGPVILARDQVNADISLRIADNDLEDTLHVRIFLDYNSETGSFLVSNCTAPASNERLRPVTCPSDRICPAIDSGDTTLHSLEAVVTDRDWLTAGEPGAEEQPPLREIAVGANRVIRGWSMKCE